MENALNKDRILSKQLITDAYQFLVEKYGRSKVQQLTPASPFIQTLNVLGELSELNFLYIENAISELNIATAKNLDNVYGLARLTGHNPTRGLAPRGKVKIKLQVSYEDFDGDYLLIPKYSKLKCLNNNLTYLLFPETDYIKIEKVGVKEVEVNIIEGTVETQGFQGIGEKLQSFSVISKSLTDHFHINVTVNGESYKQVESLYEMLSDEKAVIIKTGISGGLDIYFGSGDFGYIPEQGAIINVTYIKTNGEAANIPSRTERVEYDFEDIGYNIFGDELNLKNILSIGSLMNPNFGANEEDSNFTRMIAPYMSKNFVLINPDNYYYYLKKFNYFSVINVYNTTEDQYKDDDNVVYMFLIPDIKKKLTSEYDYFSLNQEEFILTENEKIMITRLINESGQQLIGSEIKFVTPQIKKYVLNIVLSYYDTFDKATIITEIKRKLNEYFINISRRDIIPRSDIITLLSGTDGVDSSTAFFISEENENAIIKGFYTKQVFAYDQITKRREWVETKKIILKEDEDPNLGLNEFGDIQMEEADIPIIRGGWSDATGIMYEEDLTSNLSGLNIFFKDSVEYNLYVRENDKILKNLMNTNL